LNIVSDLLTAGEEVWSRFKGGRDGTFSYYGALVTAFAARGRSGLTNQLQRVVTEIELCA
jgi:hypothetical protein